MREPMNDHLRSPASSADEQAGRPTALCAVTPALLDQLGDPAAQGRLRDLGCGINEPALTAARR